MRRIGGFELYAVTDGLFRLDGGAMFGIVPKILWEKHAPPDERNRIRLSFGCLLLKTPSGKWVLVDTGLSDKYEKNPKFLKMYGVDRRDTLFAALKQRGLAPEDISLVINSHLHFDHAGGDTVWGDDGRPRPAFPRAKYVINKDEWHDATHPHERNQASYLIENFGCLQDFKALELVDGDARIEKGLQVVHSGGHTRGHQCILIQDGDRSALFLGDLVPTRAHVPLPWIMAYDLYPVESLESRRRLLGRAKKEGWLLIFQHDPEQLEGYLRDVDGKETVVAPGPEG